MRRLTFGGTLNHHPIWSPDGVRILYRTNREGDIAEFWQRADGTGAPERLTKPDTGTTHGADSFLPGEQKFLFIVLKPPDTDIWLYSLPDKKTTPVIQIPSSAQNNAFTSPDGRWLAYQSDETGRFEIYVQPYPPTGGKFQITRDGGQHPLWSRDGKELFYEHSGHLMSVAIRYEPILDLSIRCRYRSPRLCKDKEVSRASTISRRTADNSSSNSYRRRQKDLLPPSKFKWDSIGYKS